MAIAPNLNHITVAGNLTKDIELKKIGSKGVSKISFTIAKNNNFKDKDGNWHDDVSYFDVEAWGQLADKISNDAKKGNSVLIEGELRQNRWEDQDKRKHSKVFIKAEKIFVLDEF